MNLNDARRRIRWTTIAILLGASIFLSILDSTGNLDLLFGFLQDPLTAVAGWTSRQTDTVADALSGPRDLDEARAQIDELQTQLDALERENEELREIQGEWQILQDLFNRARQTPQLRRQTANVIGYDTSPAVRSIIIDKGSDDGLQVGMPVESSRGLIGRIFRTTQNSAQVVLITDNASAIPVRLGTSRATGSLRGRGATGDLYVEWIDLKFQIEIGEVVLTSGLGGDFPQDIVIGRVVQIDRNESDLFQQAIVQPATDFETMEIVFVITDFNQIDTSIFESPTGN
ncbi:MAG: rod shape-determining protein MreC [Ardenticatenaceae bacterium]|nr:rod shape-determining protein MreC [Anaerolineales bacterium]MCB8938443.1 rod shape-determining protein MreC [Ardenticatenaceae bacterium]MCB8975244.1 rod shape-determining protein MreC [Ardenticatenaceae bacterium]